MNVERESPQQSPPRRRADLCRVGLAGLAKTAPIGALLTLFAAAPALGQEERSSAPSLPDSGGEDAPASAEGDRIQTLEERMTELSDRLRESEELRQKSISPLTWNGYVDFGYFVPIGNRGAGWVRDSGVMRQFPQYANYSWTFLGDILATAINTRGEVADLGDAPDAPRFDSVNSDGASGFILNEINLRPRFQLSERAILRASVNFVPRSGSDFALGDFVDADLGELEYLLTADGKTSLFVGKTMPVFGIEYKQRKSDQRYGITPSLISRYTVGSQLGLKMRSKLLDDWLIFAASVTNNSSTIEMFHFYSEIDKNDSKFLNGRAAVSIPVGRVYHTDDRLEIGVSGEWGGQDRATDDAGKMWLAGLDLQFLGVNYAIRGQLLEGRSPGHPDALDGVWGLHLNPSGFIELEWQILAQFGIYARVENRDALVTLGSERIYVTKEWRVTAGIHVVVNSHIIVKGEYLHNDEYGGINEFDNDVVTSSLVLAF
jgi:hypothetical protein